MRYERALAIQGRHELLLALIRAGQFSTPVLAEKIGVSEQTIYRDIDFLKECGYSIEAKKHSKSWAYHILAEPITSSTEKDALQK